MQIADVSLNHFLYFFYRMWENFEGVKYWRIELIGG